MLPEFAEMLSALSEAGAEHVVVGGYAVGVHGEPRATKDIDILVRPSRTNARRVMAALNQFGAPRLGLTIDDLSTSGMVFQIGVPPRRIDILTAIEAVTFDEAWASCVEVRVHGLTSPVPFLGREALLRNKKAVGRPQDLADVAKIEAMDSKARRRPSAKRRKR